MKREDSISGIINDLRWSLDYIEELKFIKIRTCGKANFNDIIRLNKEVIQYAYSKDCQNFLLDHRDCYIDLSVEDVCCLSNFFDENGLNNWFKIAILLNKSDLKELKFKLFYAIFSSLGRKYKLFHKVDDALEWIYEEQMVCNY